MDTLLDIVLCNDILVMIYGIHLMTLKFLATPCIILMSGASGYFSSASVVQSGNHTKEIHFHNESFLETLYIYKNLHHFNFYVINIRS